MRIPVVVLVALTLGLVACASSGTDPGTRRSTRVITTEELETVEELNAYEAVQRLRPNWLRTRGRVSMQAQQGIQLYVDGVHRGYVADLVSIRANAVQRMEYLSASQATARFGTDHVDGAVLVRLRRG
jgi:hypothetical protein